MAAIGGSLAACVGAAFEWPKTEIGGAAIRSIRLLRPRVNDRLARATRFPITLISAPAGFGKSIALRDLIETSGLDVVLCDIGRDGGTLPAFARRLSESLASAAPTALAAFPQMLQRVMTNDDPASEVAQWFVEHLNEKICTIAIDDVHVVTADDKAIRMLSELIDRTCEHVTWILATRSDSGLPVASWMAYGRMDLPIGEHDLCFTREEALAVANESQSGIGADEVEMLRELTGGWPVALFIALRTRTHAADLRSATAGARELIYRYLAEQIFNSLSVEQRKFLLDTSVFSTFDTAIAQELAGTSESLAEVRRAATFLYEVQPGEYRYHDLFRDFLVAELRRSGSNAWTSALCRAAELLEKHGREASALALYAEAADAAAVLRILERSGFSLFERGEREPLTAALDSVPEEQRRDNAILLGLRAMLEAGLGHFDFAERKFLQAIECAGDLRLRTLLVHRYAIELVRRGRDCIALLEPFASSNELGPEFAAPILGTLSTAYVGVARYDDAAETMRRALDLLAACGDDEIRARVFQQAAYVHLHAQPFERARGYAEIAIELAMAHNLYEVAARACNVLYAVVYDEDDDPVTCLRILEQAAQCAAKGGSTQSRLFALIASYELEVERGNDPRLEQLDRVLEESRNIFPQGYLRSLLPAEAMRAGWSGEFQRAYSILAGSAANEETAERRALRLCEIALYAAAAGLHAEADGALHAARASLEKNPAHTRRAVRSHLFLALAELARGRSSGAYRHIQEAERAAPPAMRRLRTLALVVRTLYGLQLGQVDPAALSSALERLREQDFGGLARLICAIPFPETADHAFSALTPAEREILQFLAKGLSTKAIAVKTGRSPYTVDTHIRSICRKLKCSGRREALALAIAAGWVQS